MGKINALHNCLYSIKQSSKSALKSNSVKSPNYYTRLPFSPFSHRDCLRQFLPSTADSRKILFNNTDEINRTIKHATKCLYDYPQTTDCQAGDRQQLIKLETQATEAERLSSCKKKNEMATIPPGVATIDF